MKQIMNRLMILAYCLGALLFTEPDTAFLVAFLFATIYTCGHYYITHKNCRLFLSIFYIPLVILRPEFALFFPCILYGVMEDGQHILAVLTGGLCFFRLLPCIHEFLFFLLLGSILALLLNYHSVSYAALEQNFKKTRDDGVEKNLLLKEKNQALLEKQDYEIYTATLRERNRIAREIHDNVGHMLSRSILLTGAIRTVNRDHALTPSLEQLETTLNTAMTNIRESVHDLHDESVNLKEVLSGLVKEFTFCPVQMEYDMGCEVPRAVKYSFISIVKEALNNVMRHSNATKVHLIVREHPALYQLMIEDNGNLTHPERDTGMGLLNMKDRISALNGMMQIQTEHGFRIFITIPKKEDF